MNKQNRNIIKNFLTQEEVSLLKSYIKMLMLEKDYVFINEVDKKHSGGKWVVNHYVGRINITINKEGLPTDIFNIVTKYSKEINGNSEFNFIEFVRYSNNFGNPRVDPHIDPPSKQAFMFNLQIDANIDWPLVEYIDEKISEMVLKNNECAVMDVNRVVHWRKPMAFKDGNYVDMAFVHFNDNSIEPVPESWYPLPPSWKDTNAFIHSKNYSESISSEYPSTKDYDMDKLGQIVKDNVNNNGLKALLGL